MEAWKRLGKLLEWRSSGSAVGSLQKACRRQLELRHRSLFRLHRVRLLNQFGAVGVESTDSNLQSILFQR